MEASKVLETWENDLGSYVEHIKQKGSDEDKESFGIMFDGLVAYKDMVLMAIDQIRSDINVLSKGEDVSHSYAEGYEHACYERSIRLARSSCRSILDIMRVAFKSDSDMAKNNISGCYDILTYNLIVEICELYRSTGNEPYKVEKTD